MNVGACAVFCQYSDGVLLHEPVLRVRQMIQSIFTMPRLAFLFIMLTPNKGLNVSFKNFLNHRFMSFDVELYRSCGVLHLLAA